MIHKLSHNFMIGVFTMKLTCGLRPTSAGRAGIARPALPGISWSSRSCAASPVRHQLVEQELRGQPCAASAGRAGIVRSAMPGIS